MQEVVCHLCSVYPYSPAAVPASVPVIRRIQSCVSPSGQNRVPKLNIISKLIALYCERDLPSGLSQYAVRGQRTT